MRERTPDGLEGIDLSRLTHVAAERAQIAILRAYLAERREAGGGDGPACCRVGKPRTRH